MKLVRIPAGKFLMGSPKDEKDRSTNEEQHEVEITKPFNVGVYEVTQIEYQRVMHTNPSHFSAGGYAKDIVKGLETSRLPVENVSWQDAMAFCKNLSAIAQEKRENRVYRLPTEAEWEYACRGGASSSIASHFGPSLSSKQANIDGNFPYGIAEKGPLLKRSTEVGSYRANAFGLYDMHGNVWEWCADWFDPNYYAKSPLKDPQGPPTGTVRVLRGGSLATNGRDSRAAHRDNNVPDLRYFTVGFRVVFPARGTP